MNTTCNQITAVGSEQPKGSIEYLRYILELKHGRNVSQGEAEEVGDSLISFFEVLAAADRSTSTYEE